MSEDVVSPEKPVKAMEKGEVAERTSWKRWVFGWIVVPGAFLASIVFAGLLYGAHFSESWLVRAVMWVVGG